MSTTQREKCPFCGEMMPFVTPRRNDPRRYFVQHGPVGKRCRGSLSEYRPK